MSSKKKRQQLLMKKREEGFVSNVRNERVPQYSALSDVNLRHYFENRKLQKHLYSTGLIDRTGRVIDMERHKGKIAIIEQEFKYAEKAEYMRQKEENDMRQRVQKKRHSALDEARKLERMAKMKEDRRIRQEIVRASREYICPDLEAALASSKSTPNLSRKKRTTRKSPNQ